MKSYWKMHTEVLDRNTLRMAVCDCERTLSFAEVFQLMERSEPFRGWFSTRLGEIPMEAYYWEMPPLTKDCIGARFECVVINAPTLADIPVDRFAFSEHFHSATGNVVCFRNLGGDSTLVAPIPICGGVDYRHLAVFLRNAPVNQACQLWQVLVDALRTRISDRSIWLSTSGLGVGWLHLRLDTYPKYYNYLPYRKNP